LDRIAFDRKMAGRTLVLALLLCWPLLVFGRPGYFGDTPGYYAGGRAAVGFVLRQFEPPSVKSQPAESRSATPPSSATPIEAEEVKAVRSIPYSLLAFLFGGTDASERPLVMLQALLVAFTTTAFLTIANVTGLRFWGAAAVLALATPAAWVASFAMPDAFASLTILVIAMLCFRAERLTTPIILTLCGLGALAISTHTSHLAIALLLVPLGLVWSALVQWRTRGRIDRRALLWAATPIVVGMAAVVVAGFVGFGELSLAPKHYPLTLARSIGDGPARWWLERHCASERYAVCELYGVKLPQTSNDFLWGPEGVKQVASPTQMERLRAEEPEILLKTTLAYPAASLKASLDNVVRQLTRFRIDEENFDARMMRKPDGFGFVADPRMPPALQSAVNVLSIASALLALAWVLLSIRSIAPEWRAMILFIVAGLVANAAVCSILSGASDRYQARVVWLLPLAAAALPWPFRRQAAQPPKQTPP
jgi:hypothetical protein